MFRQTYNVATNPIRKMTTAVYRIINSSDTPVQEPVENEGM